MELKRGTYGLIVRGQLVWWRFNWARQLPDLFDQSHACIADRGTVEANHCAATLAKCDLRNQEICKTGLARLSRPQGLNESPRDLWRLNTLRGLSPEQVQQVFTIGP